MPRKGFRDISLDAGTQRSRALAITLHELYPDLALYVQVRNLRAIQEMSSHGINKVGADYVGNTLAGGRLLLLLLDTGVTEADANSVVNDLKQNAYAAIRSAHTYP